MNDTKEKLIGLQEDIDEYRKQISAIETLAAKRTLIGENQEHSGNPSPYFKRRAFIDKDLKIIRITEPYEALNESYQSLGIMIVIDAEDTRTQVGHYYNPLNGRIYYEPPVIDYDFVVSERGRERPQQAAWDILKAKCDEIEKREIALRGALGLDKIDSSIAELYKKIYELTQSVGYLRYSLRYKNE